MLAIRIIATILISINLLLSIGLLILNERDLFEPNKIVRICSLFNTIALIFVIVALWVIQ